MSMILHSPDPIPVSVAEKVKWYFGLEKIVPAEDHDPYPLSEKQVAEFKSGRTLFVTNISPGRLAYNLHSGRVVSMKQVIEKGIV